MDSDRPIPYATATTPLGCLLVAGTTDGIVSVKLADTSLKETLIAQLQQEFGAVEEVRDATLAEWLQALVDYLQGGPWPQLPTRTSGTEFQQQVWQQLRAIPVGTTVSYGDLAEQMGLQPGAARAVGRACATNPVALVVPCHRVVSQSGALTGFRWGVERKRALLELEQQHADTQLELLPK